MGKKILLTLLTALSIVGCNKNNGGNNQPIAPVGPGGNWGACSSCTAGMQSPIVALAGVKSSDVGEEILIALDLVINGSIPNFPYQDPKAFLYYQGPATIQGVIRVTRANDPLVCFIAPGDYAINPLQLSYASNGVIGGGSFEAVGPGGKIMFRMGQSQVNNMTDPNGVYQGSATNRIGLNLYIDSVSNYPYPCGQLSTY